MSLTSLARFRFMLTLAFLTSSLDAQTVFLYSPQVTCPCFHYLYPLFLCLSLAKSSLFIHTGLLAFLPDFVAVQIEFFWAWRRCSLDINHLSWTPLPSKVLSHRTPPKRPLMRPKSALLKSRVVSLLFTLLSALRILNSTISWPLQPRLPLIFTYATSRSLWVSMRSRRAPVLIGFSVTLRRKLSMVHSRNLLDSYAQLCCPSSRCQGGPPWGPGPVLPQEPVSLHCNILVMGAIPPCFFNPSKIIGLQLYTDLELVFIPHNYVH